MSLRARIHRKIGFSVAAFLTLFVCSGILLHHASNLNLDSTFVDSTLILDYYGFDQAPSAQSINAFALNENSMLVQIDDHVYLNQQSIFNFHGNADKVIAAIDVLQYTAFATQQQIYVFDISGELFDVMDAPFPVMNMALMDEKLIIMQSDAGYSQLDDNMLNWETISPDSITGRYAPILWSRPLVLQPEQLLTIWSEHRRTLLSWTRVLQDLHSGRIGGWIGNLVADAAAIALLFLAISGLTMGRREKENGSQSRSKTLQ